MQMSSLRERPRLPSYFPSILSTFPIHVSWEPDQSYHVKIAPVVSLSWQEQRACLSYATVAICLSSVAHRWNCHTHLWLNIGGSRIFKMLQQLVFMVIMVIKQTKVSTDLCIENLSVGSQCLWLPETIHGHQCQWLLWLSWLSVVISGFLWLPEPVHGHQWFLWLSWLSVHQCFYGYHGYQWLSVVISGFPIACAWSPVVFMVISGYMHG